jgi:hypothetical protein
MEGMFSARILALLESGSATTDDIAELAARHGLALLWQIFWSGCIFRILTTAVA